MQRTVYIDGVPIKLTRTQIKTIERAREERKKCGDSFKAMLEHFHFKEIKDVPGSFEHEYFNWYAEISSSDNHPEVWLTGSGLKSSSFPGGWIYSEVSDLEKAILEGIEKLSL